MKVIEIIIVAVVLALFVAGAVVAVRRARKGSCCYGCGGNCGSCNTKK